MAEEIEVTMTMLVDGHRDILRREFLRISDLTDAAYAVMRESPSAVSQASYKDWAALLLRYHAAIEQIEPKDGSPLDLPSMKDSP